MPDDTPDDGMDLCAAANLALARPILERISDKWTILILAVLATEPKRFNALKRELGGITHKALSDALKRMERNGLISRAVLPTSPVGVEYAITPLGLSLQAPVHALVAWAIAHQDSFNAVRESKATPDAK